MSEGGGRGDGVGGAVFVVTGCVKPAFFTAGLPVPAEGGCGIGTGGGAVKYSFLPTKLRDPPRVLMMINRSNRTVNMIKMSFIRGRHVPKNREENQLSRESRVKLFVAQVVARTNTDQTSVETATIHDHQTQLPTIMQFTL